mgnify:CR=1 FL=1
MSIFSQLPNRLIMDIIKMADGGLHTHKQQMKDVLKNIFFEPRQTNGDIEEYIDIYGRYYKMVLEIEERYEYIIDGSGEWDTNTNGFMARMSDMEDPGAIPHPFLPGVLISKGIE